jgi:nitroimidazol reductase NimA-like FMN-containing flavoprotein (pyridoxamine 5'-phosphate oxidase superfamily)
MKKLTSTLKQFCADEELLRVAYMSGNGFPRVFPVWFVVIGGYYFFGTGTNSAKWKAMSQNPRVGWVIDGGKGKKYKGASMYGRAEKVVDKRLRARVYNGLGEKYYGSRSHPKFVEIYGAVDDPNTVYVRLTPEDGTLWEY